MSSIPGVYLPKDPLIIPLSLSICQKQIYVVATPFVRILVRNTNSRAGKEKERENPPTRPSLFMRNEQNSTSNDSDVKFLPFGLMSYGINVLTTMGC